MGVVQRSADVLHHLQDAVHMQALLQIVFEVAAPHKLHDDVRRRAAHTHVVDLHDVRMV